MFYRWLPWKTLVRRIARSHGFYDPVTLLHTLERFAQPSEVGVPVELLRAGISFHARGLINTKAIQGNLDWVWPYWVCRQFDPHDDAFLPRAFSITHVNLTHRNWTAVGIPGCNAFPISDPRGLLTPFYDGWSLDCWLLPEKAAPVFPSREADCDQELLMGEDSLRVRTRVGADPDRLLESVAWVGMEDGMPVCRFRCAASHGFKGSIALVLRPCNPEGLSFVHRLEANEDVTEWRIDETATVTFDRPASNFLASGYWEGDVAHKLGETKASARILQDDVGLLTAASLFPVDGDCRSVTASVDLRRDDRSHPIFPGGRVASWPESLRGAADLRIADERMKFLYDAAIRTLVLLTPDDAYPGPYTYKRFWFRDATYMLHAMLCAGLSERVIGILDTFPKRQKRNGYFHSQDGEWDSNGQALWLLHRYCELTGTNPDASWKTPIDRACRWIAGKRLPRNDELHAGLMPAGFSAEHLGNNDFYYWDDFWSIAGLKAAHHLSVRFGDPDSAERWLAEATDFREVVESSLRRSAGIRKTDAIPASPHRRMDAGAVGSLAACYPLRLYPQGERRILATASWLHENCLVGGGFFQDMIHSGVNAYLTLHLAQVFLRAGDRRFMDLVRTVARVASPTGQWPEAIHPRTGGGCMGDGQHAWAAAEWVLMIRNAFVREEEGTLVLCSGLLPEWLGDGEEIRFGPAPTPWGEISIRAQSGADGLRIGWKADWRENPPPIVCKAFGHIPETIARPDRVGEACLRAETRQ